MKVGFLIFAVTAFFLADAWHDGKYTSMLKSWKKYYKMGLIAFAGISAYAFLKKNPKNSKEFACHAAELIKTLPIDKDAGDFLTPFLSNQSSANINSQQQRLLTSGITKRGGSNIKRSVSETKKKYVASQQNWTCGNCKKQLPAWFEVDHRVRLDSGGTNHISNLVALCRDCHGKKTTYENL